MYCILPLRIHHRHFKPLEMTLQSHQGVRLAGTGGAEDEMTANRQVCSFSAHSKITRLLTPQFALDSSGSSTTADHKTT